MKNLKNNIWKLVLLGILVVGVFISLVSFVKGMFTEKDIIIAEELALYKVPNRLVKNYNTYYYSQDCIENLIEGCKRGLHNDMYKMYLKDYRKSSKEETINFIKTSLEGKNYRINKMYDLGNEGILISIYFDDKEVNILLQSAIKENETYSFAIIG